MAEDSPLPEQPSFAVPSLEEMHAYLPQFNFEKLAACGGMGAVYQASQPSLERKVAVKILPPEFGSEPEFATRFQSEARAMARLNHTNIVGVYDFGITPGGHLFLVMEWVDGRSLHDVIHAGSLSLRKATNLAIQLCEALTFAHENRIIHRDIKPGNIMVNDADHVKVADFGLARPISDEAEQDNPFGTPDYAAPEIRGGSVVDHRVDIYAAGVVLYEMLTGTVPGEPRRSVTEFAAIAPRWDQIIARAIDPDPEKRYQDAGEFRAHIVVAMKQTSDPTLPDLAPAPAPAPRKPRPPAPAVKLTQRQQIMMVIGLVAVVLAGLAFLIFRTPSAPHMSGAGGMLAPAEPTPAEIREVLQKLSQTDSELVKLLASFSEDWAASGASRGGSSDAAEKLRQVQSALLKAKVKDRMDAARRAEIVAAALEKHEGVPSLKALQEAAK